MPLHHSASYRPGTTLPTLTWDLTQITIPGIGQADTVIFYPSQAEAQNGTITLKNAEEGGAIFELTFYVDSLSFNSLKNE